MVTEKAVSKSKKTSRTKVSTKNSRKEAVSDVVVKKKVSNNSEMGVSVFTKTTNPKVVVQSENLDTTKAFQNQNICWRRFLKSTWMIVMSIIVLMTFFLALKMYSIVSELSVLLSN